MRSIVRITIELGYEAEESSSEQDNYVPMMNFVGQMAKKDGPVVLEDKNVQRAITQIFMELFSTALTFQVEKQHVRAPRIEVAGRVPNPTERN